jgi:hypothetical protein
VVQIPTGFAILKVVDDADPANINMNAVNPASLATAANVKYVIDVSGSWRRRRILQAFPKPAAWNQDPRARSARRAANPGIVARLARRFLVA